MLAVMKLLTPRDLRHLAAAPEEAASAFSAPPYLLVEAGAEFDEPGLDRWIASVPAPVIAVGDAASPLAQACDLHLPSAGHLPGLLRNIEAAPLAAAVLVQTLRLSHQLDAADALIVESMAYASLQHGAEFRRWQAGYRTPAPSQQSDQGPAVELIREEDCLHIRLNRPRTRNAMTVELRDGLNEALGLALADGSISKVTLDAAGRCFSTGGDPAEFGTAPDPATAHAVRSMTLPGRLLHRLAHQSTVRVHGACIGSGIEFPAFAGRVIAQANAWFQLPELRYGLIPGAGGTVSIARRIGRQRTAWLALSGARIDARTALAWGLVDQVEA